ncbi:MAG: response regulator transcription factor, partial [Actinobacteria bacterium]
MRLRIIVADDHPVVCSGLRQLLERDGTIEIVAEARDGRTLLRQVDALQPDLVVADVTMPDLNGIDATRIIRQRYSGTRVLLLSVHAQEAI